MNDFTRRETATLPRNQREHATPPAGFNKATLPGARIERRATQGKVE